MTVAAPEEPDAKGQPSNVRAATKTTSRRIRSPSDLLSPAFTLA
jgi:hypothetical protein